MQNTPTHSYSHSRVTPNSPPHILPQAPHTAACRHLPDSQLTLPALLPPAVPLPVCPQGASRMLSQRMADELMNMGLDEAMPLARALGHYLNLTSIAELHHRYKGGG